MGKRSIILFVTLLLLAAGALVFQNRLPLWFGRYEIGEAIDSLNGVKVYYNGPISNVSGRNVSADGYNIGQQYQCVEFVKRYYYEHLKHKMPNSYGHARDFVDPSLPDSSINKQRNLMQYKNPSKSKPNPDDLLVMGGGYGHVMIVASVGKNDIEIIQQNPGKTEPSRKKIEFTQLADGRWKINNKRIIGWLRKE